MPTEHTYVAQACDHETTITFDDGEEPFDSKTLGCRVCGETSPHNRKDMIEHGDNTEVSHGSEEDESSEEDTDVATDETTVYAASTDEMVEDLSYRAKQQVASEFDDVQGNQSDDDLTVALAQKTPSRLDDAIAAADVGGDE